MPSESHAGIVLTEALPDPFSDIRSVDDTPQNIIARAIQRDGRALGIPFDADFALELAEGVLAGLGYDDDAVIDAQSFVFDDDVRRALSA